MIKRCIKTLILSALMLIASNSLFAVEEYISEIYKDLDRVFIVKSDDDLNEILSKNKKDKYYYLIENYTEKKIRRLIVNNDYDFAMTAIIIVIENNMDNENAVEMYTVISDAYEIQQQHEIEEEQKRQRELVRIELAKEKQRGSAEKEFISAKNDSGKAVYVSGKETKLSSSSWKGLFGLANLTYLFDKPGDINSFHYGIAADFRYEYTIDKQMVVGFDINGGANFLTISPKEEKNVPFMGDANLSFKIAKPSISKDLFLRAGVGVLFSSSSDKAVDAKNVLPTMFTPTLGIKMERLPLGNVKLDLGADWYVGHLFVNNLNFAMGAEANLEFPFAETERVKLSINVGLKDRFFMKQSGIENRASLILGIGAENVIK